MDYKKRSILILGINNFIGYNLAIYLSNTYNIIGTYSSNLNSYNKLENYRFKKLKNKKVKLIKYKSPKDNLVKISNKIKPDFFIFNMFVSNHWNTTKYNFEGNKKIIFNNINELINSLNKNNCSGFLITGSSEDYSVRNTKVHEKFTTAPSNSYGKLINIFSKHVKELCKQNKINFVYFRLFSPFGLLDKKNKILEELLLSNKDMVKINNSKVKRNFTYVKDIARSYEKIIKLFLKKNNESIIINVFNDSKFNLVKFVNTFLYTFKKNTKIHIDQKISKDKFNYGLPNALNRRKYIDFKFKDLDQSMRDIYKDYNSEYLNYYKKKYYD
jgi:nucleoside-diphosphate-sugar epimerase